jgi:hypothetical protein
MGSGRWPGGHTGIEWSSDPRVRSLILPPPHHARPDQPRPLMVRTHQTERVEPMARRASAHISLGGGGFTVVRPPVPSMGRLASQVLGRASQPEGESRPGNSRGVGGLRVWRSPRAHAPLLNAARPAPIA